MTSTTKHLSLRAPLAALGSGRDSSGIRFGASPEITVHGVTKPQVIPTNSDKTALELKNPPALIVVTANNSDSKASATTFVTRPI